MKCLTLTSKDVATKSFAEIEKALENIITPDFQEPYCDECQSNICQPDQHLDVIFTYHGSIVLARGASDAGREWISDNFDYDEDVIHFAGQVAIEPRYAQNIIDGAINDGLTVSC